MRLLALLVVTTIAFSVHAQHLPFLSDDEVAAIASEVSGESAKRSVEGFSRQHRMRGSREYRAAADQIINDLKRYGFEDAHIETFPADGVIFYGTQRSRPPWNAEIGELWEVDANGVRLQRLASWEAAPITLAQDSTSADVTAELIDIGGGSEAELANKELGGRIVLTSSQPGAVAQRVLARGAVGIVSYAQNQRTAWYGEDENLIRWGHLDTFAEKKTFGFMVSLKTARQLQARLARGEGIRLHAKVIAGQEPGAYELPMATIRGTSLPEEEIVYSCHLDHPRPGANDNASGCATILEIARTLSKLIAEKRLAPPKRTIRFVWPPEIEGTLALLNGRPELARRMKAAVHLDMVGGGAETKAIFHVTRGPASLPSFVHDLAQTIGAFVNEQTAAYAMTGSAKFPLVASDGSRDPLRAAFVAHTMGSDHDVYNDSSWGIPAVYFNDWPDRYIHTNADVPANIDSTKLERVAFLAAATGYTLATLETSDTAELQALLDTYALERRAAAMRRKDPYALRLHEWYEREMKSSIAKFFGTVQPSAAAPSRRAGGKVYARNANVKGPTGAFGYDYFDAHYKGPALKLAADLRYEALNFVDGKRSASEIRDLLSGIDGPVALEDVEAYLAALASIEVIKPAQ